MPCSTFGSIASSTAACRSPMRRTLGLPGQCPQPGRAVKVPAQLAAAATARSCGRQLCRLLCLPGTFFEENAKAVEEQVTDAAPLSEDGDILAMSWDGVMVATRGESGSTAWREAGGHRLGLPISSTCCRPASPANGRSSPGCKGPVPISVTSMPKIGNANFALTCGNAPPNATGGPPATTAAHRTSLPSTPMCERFASFSTRRAVRRSAQPLGSSLS